MVKTKDIKGLEAIYIHNKLLYGDSTLTGDLIKAKEAFSVCLQRIDDDDVCYLQEDAVRHAVLRLLVGINSDLFLQGVKSSIDTKTTVENLVNEIKEKAWKYRK